MVIKLQDEQQLKDNLKQAKETIDSILAEDLGEKELTEENFIKVKNIQDKILKLHYIDYRGSRVKIISPDGTELTEINFH